MKKMSDHGSETTWQPPKLDRVLTVLVTDGSSSSHSNDEPQTDDENTLSGQNSSQTTQKSTSSQESAPPSLAASDSDSDVSEVIPSKKRVKGRIIKDESLSEIETNSLCGKRVSSESSIQDDGRTYSKDNNGTSTYSTATLSESSIDSSDENENRKKRLKIWNEESSTDSNEDNEMRSRKRKLANIEDDEPSFKRHRIGIAEKIQAAQNEESTPEVTMELTDIDKNPIFNHIERCSKCKSWNDVSRTDLPLSIDVSYASKHRDGNNEYDSTDWMLNPVKRTEAIFKICEDLDIDPTKPAVDCFASDENRHDGLLYLTERNNFFDEKWDCPLFWALLIAWSNPPFNSMIEKTIETYAKRKMRGFVCGPIWLETEYQYRNRWSRRGKAMPGCKGSYEFESINEHDVFFRPGAKQSESCPFNTLILYLDFRS